MPTIESVDLIVATDSGRYPLVVPFVNTTTVGWAAVTTSGWFDTSSPWCTTRDTSTTPTRFTGSTSVSSTSHVTSPPRYIRQSPNEMTWTMLLALSLPSYGLRRGCSAGGVAGLAPAGGAIVFRRA